MTPPNKQAADALTALQQRQFEKAMQFTQFSFEQASRMLDLQLQAARDLLEAGVQNAQSVAQARSPEDAMRLQGDFAQRSAERVLICGREVAEVASGLQQEFGRVVSEQFSNSGKELAEAITGLLQSLSVGNGAANLLQSAMDNARSTMEQVTKASTEALTAMSGSAAKPATRSRSTATKT